MDYKKGFQMHKGNKSRGKNVFNSELYISIVTLGMETTAGTL